MMPRKPTNHELARRKGEEIARAEGFTALPVDPFEIAKRHEIEVQEKADSDKGISGALVRQGDTFGILFATHIKSVGYQRFSVSHELGHYFLEGHPEKLLPGNGIHRSRAGFVSNDECELEADHFAAGLLMPRFLVEPAIARSKDGLEGIISIAELCLTSLTATAIRYVELTDCPAAIIISTGQVIDYCFMSESLRGWNREVEWIRKGTGLPSSSATSMFNQNAEKIESAEKDESPAELTDWFGGGIEATGKEEVIGLGSYGKTLTVLSFPNLPDDEELEEDERIEDSLTPRFRR